MKNPLLYGNGEIGASFNVTEEDMNMNVLSRVVEQCNNSDFYHKFIVSIQQFVLIKNGNS